MSMVIKEVDTLVEPSSVSVSSNAMKVLIPVMMKAMALMSSPASGTRDRSMSHLDLSMDFPMFSLALTSS